MGVKSHQDAFGGAVRERNLTAGSAPPIDREQERGVVPSRSPADRAEEGRRAVEAPASTQVYLVGNNIDVKMTLLIMFV